MGKENKQEEKSRLKREGGENKGEGRDTPMARKQAATSQPDTRSGESKIYRRRERQKVQRQNIGEEQQVQL